MTVLDNLSFEIPDGGDARLPAVWSGGGINTAIEIADFGQNQSGAEDFEDGWTGGALLVVFDPTWPAAIFETAHGPKTFEPFDSWSDWFPAFPAAAAAVFTSYPVATVETFDAGWQNDNFVVPFEVFPVTYALTAIAHPFLEGEPVTLATTGALPTPFAIGTTYWIHVDSPDLLTLLDAPLGAPVGPATDVGSGFHTILYDTFPFSWADGDPFSTAALFDAGADDAEDFEGGWQNTTYPTSWTDGSGFSIAATFGPGAIAHENFESVLGPNVFTVDVATSTLTTAAPHTLSNGDKVTVALDTSAASLNLVGLLPTGLQPVVVYTAIVTGASTLQLSFDGATPIAISDQGAGVYVLVADPTRFWTTILGL